MKFRTYNQIRFYAISNGVDIEDDYKGNVLSATIDKVNYIGSTKNKKEIKKYKTVLKTVLDYYLKNEPEKVLAADVETEAFVNNVSDSDYLISVYDSKLLIEDALISTIKARNDKKFDLIIKEGADPNSKDMRPVIIASKYGTPHMLETLNKDFKIDWNTSDNMCLLMASRFQSKENINNLISYGAVAGCKKDVINKMLEQRFGEDDEEWLKSLAL